MERTCDQLSERCRASRVDVQKAKESREPSGENGCKRERERERERESGKAGRLSHEVSRTWPIRGDARNGGRVCTHDTVKLPRQKQLRYSPTVRVTRPRDNEEERAGRTVDRRRRRRRNAIARIRLPPDESPHELIRVIVPSRAIETWCERTLCYRWTDSEARIVCVSPINTT